MLDCVRERYLEEGAEVVDALEGVDVLCTRSGTSQRMH